MAEADMAGFAEGDDRGEIWSIEQCLAALEGWAATRQAMSGRSELARALGAMVDACRLAERDRVPIGRSIRSRAGVFELRPDAAFAVHSRNTSDVGSYQLHRIDRPCHVGTIAIKAGRLQPPSDGAIGVLSEAMFYCFLRDGCAVSGLRIAELLAINPFTDEEGQIFLEYLPGCRAIAGFDELRRAARAIGRFSGDCHRRALHDATWMRTGSLNLLPQQLAEFDLLLQQLPGGEAHTGAIEDGFSGVLRDFLALRERHGQGPPTLCHGDLHARNLLALDGDEFAALDWAWVNRGRVGDDLAVLAYPWLVTSPHADADIDFAAADAGLLQAYREGAEIEAIGATYRLKSVVTSLNMARHYRRWMLQPRDRGERHRRALRVGRFYRFMAEQAAKIAP